ncbi:MAG: SusC/RagA family TonB-linked outer membrane protein [Candidatus Pseudobacter hemicellulosilyticus]|uniref:SusC/RagA family TonB-linked outer membrane protein n=1 Tax=Candidatus Pseudobacter hemicellulosilyticus TaxID=3121375 RepID=A0AAJ5WXS7_9BACT|nr:MAG: SusC/RagA family TonB-linked outer membrane protein [Pseudobacter sp.]
MNTNNISRRCLLGLLLLTVFAGAQAQAPESDTVTVPQKAAVREPGRLITVPKLYSSAAVATVSGETLYGSHTPNLTNTLSGRLAGLTVLQNSGEPGNDEAMLGIRGISSYGYGGFSSYKIFVDGFETNRNYFRNLSAAEIESVSILKDAAALSTFGMRGANGVLWITTKRGRIGKPTVQVQARTGFQSAINIAKPLGSYEYASLYNQAVSNDKKSWSPSYTAEQLEAYRNGTGTDVSWYDEVLKRQGLQTDADVIFSGGDPTVRYNVVLNYANQRGLYNVDNTDTSSNQLFTRYNIRTNLDFTMFKIFEARVDLGGRIESRKMPNYWSFVDGAPSTSSLWNNLARYPSNIYPVRDEETGEWSGSTVYRDNPLASVTDLGWQSFKSRILQGNFELKEKLDMITPGLYAIQSFSFNSYSLTGYSKTSTYARFLNGTKTTTDQTTTIQARAQSSNGQEDWKQGAFTVGYERQFAGHQVNAAVNYQQSDYKGDGFYSSIYRYQNISGRANYVYRNRYIGDIGFSYFGTDAYASGNRWGFYPAVSAGWIISNEDFLMDNTTFSLLKLRASAGATGSADASQGSPQGQNGRYLYQQYYVASTGFYTGDGAANGQTALNPLYVANPNLFAEKSMKYNVGVDIGLFSKLDLTVDVFLEKRSDIITRDNTIPGSYGSIIYIANIGKQTNKGFEVTAAYNDRAGKLQYSLFGTAAYNRNKIDYMGELTPAYPYNAETGRAYGTPIGLVATGYYQLNDFNADGNLKAGLPAPAFGKVQPGDLRYEDLDDNGIVDNNDRTAIGKSGYPELSYSVGATVAYAGFDLTAFLQGSAGFSINILNAGNQNIAFVNNGNAYAIARGAWAYYPEQGIDTRAAATYPRLTTQANDNNYRLSSFWMKNRDYLRIRNIELGYSLNARLLNRTGLTKLRLYVSALNPVTWSNLLKDYDMDPEVISGYPALKSFSTGISLTF